MGGRGSSSNMASSSTSSSRGFMSNRQNMEDYAVAVGMFDRDFLRTAEGRQALQEFIRDEKEAGLTERDMRNAIQSTNSGQKSSVPILVNNSDGLKRQVQDARQNGYKSPQVDNMVRQAQAAGWKETYPGYGSDGTAYRKMQTQGTGALSNRQARVTVNRNGARLYVTDGNKASEYSFGNNIFDAIKSGNNFVSTSAASTRRDGPRSDKFIVRSRRNR